MLKFFWSFGVKIKPSNDKIDEFICKDNCLLLTVIYNNNGEAVVQSVDKFGIQRTVYTKNVESPGIFANKTESFLRSINGEYICELKLVRPLYYAKLKFYLNHYKDEIDGKLDFSNLEEKSSEFTGYLEYKSNNQVIISRKLLSYGPSSNDFEFFVIFSYIVLNSGIEKYLNKERIFPQLYPYSESNICERKRENLKYYLERKDN